MLQEPNTYSLHVTRTKHMLPTCCKNQTHASYMLQEPNTCFLHAAKTEHMFPTCYKNQTHTPTCCKNQTHAPYMLQESNACPYMLHQATRAKQERYNLMDCND